MSNVPQYDDDDDELPPPDSDEEYEEELPKSPAYVPQKNVQSNNTVKVLVPPMPPRPPPPPPKPTSKPIKSTPSSIPIPSPSTPAVQTATAKVSENSFNNPLSRNPPPPKPLSPKPTSSPIPPPKSEKITKTIPGIPAGISLQSSPSISTLSISADTQEDGNEKEESLTTPDKRKSTMYSVKKTLSRALKPIRNSIIRPNADNSPPVIDENLILEGILSKMNREGKFEQYAVKLTKTEFIYSKQPITTESNTVDTMSRESVAYSVASSVSGKEYSVAGDNSPVPGGGGPGTDRVIPLETMLVYDLGDKEWEDNEKRERMFKLLSKTKSFFLRAKTVDLKTEWLTEMQNAVREVHSQPGVVGIKLEDTAPIWTTGDQNCYICKKQFSFFVRKHHCRNCGQCVCEPCSPDKVRILKIDEKKLYKVCNRCGDHIKNNRTYGF